MVDFTGRVAATAIAGAGVGAQMGHFAGEAVLSGCKLRYRFYGASHKASRALAMDFHSKPRLKVIRPPPRDDTIATIEALQRQLAQGNSYLVNYCSQTQVALDAELSSLYNQSTAPYTVWLEDQFLAFSPEAFVSVMDNQISTTPMKGTGFDPQLLLADAKEQAEHATVVDLLRNDLGRVARDIKLANYRYLSEIPQADGRTLFQTSSEITGTMPANWRSEIGTWLPRLLPAGSVTGAPKTETLALIHRYEAEPRGFFTGIAVLFDGESLYSCVLIRFLDLAAEILCFRSGAGITIYSDAAQEYEEILNKVYIPA